MQIRTIIGAIGLVLSGLGGLWHWRITRLTAAFAGTPMAANLGRTAKIAVGLVCFGLIVFLISMAISFLAEDEDCA